MTDPAGPDPDDGFDLLVPDGAGAEPSLGERWARRLARRWPDGVPRTTRWLAALGALALAAVVALAVVRTADAPATPSAPPPSAAANPAPGTTGTGTMDTGTTGTGTTDTGALSPFATRRNRLLDRCTPGAAALARCGPAPALRAAGPWFGSPPLQLRAGALHDRVVLLSFTTSACLPCRAERALLQRWADRYAGAGLRVVAVHRPEYRFEADPRVPAALVRRERLDIPLVSDPDGRAFTDYRDRYWPSTYLLDARGTVRAIRFGAGGEGVLETQVRRLLDAARPGIRPGIQPGIRPGIQLPARVLPPGGGLVLTPGRTSTIATRPGQAGYHGTPDYLSTAAFSYALDQSQPLGTFSLGGPWRVTAESITSRRDSQLRLHYRGREVHQVLGGRGTVTVERTGLPPRVVRVRGVPRLVRLVRTDAPVDDVLTLTYSAGLASFGFSFG